MTTPDSLSSKLTISTATNLSYADRLANTLHTLNQNPVSASVSAPRPVGSTFSLNGFSVALKCPTQSRENVCIELLHSTLDGRWLPSWGVTNLSDCYLWVLPEGAHLWVTRSSLHAYLMSEWDLLPLTNHSTATRERLRQQGKPSDVVTAWIPISTLLDECDTLCYNIDKYNPHELNEWLNTLFQSRQ